MKPRDRALLHLYNERIGHWTMLTGRPPSDDEATNILDCITDEDIEAKLIELSETPNENVG